MTKLLNEIKERRYATDLTDAQFARIEPFIPAPKPGGRPRSVDIRAVFDGIFYLLRTGCQWRMLPTDFPPWGTVQYYFRRWRLDGVWNRMEDALYRDTRLRARRNEQPSAAIMDSKSVKTTEKGASRDSTGTRSRWVVNGIFYQHAWLDARLPG